LQDKPQGHKIVRTAPGEVEHIRPHNFLLTTNKIPDQQTVLSSENNNVSKVILFSMNSIAKHELSISDIQSI